MKKKRWIIIAIAVWITFLTQPVYAAINSPENGVTIAGTSIQAVAEPIYFFSAPPNVTIIYPDTEAVIGDFVVGDLFLASGEWLTVTVITGRMTKTNDSSLRLPYDIYFGPPVMLNASNSGDAYSVTVKISADEFADAAAGRYKASLLFQVTSHPDEKVVFEGTTVVTAKMPGGAEETEEPSATTSPGGTASPSATVSPGETADPGDSAPVTTPSPGGEILDPNTGDIIVWCGLAVVALALLLLLLLFWFAVVPLVYEIIKNGDGTYTIIWGYNNRKRRIYKVSQDDSKLTIFAGTILKTELIKPSEDIAIPPIEFEKGRMEAAFKTVVEAGSIIEWKIKNKKIKIDLNKIAK
ncbi:MAG: hypothetical protein ACOX8Q_02775 [Christensenellales bacterium]